MTTLQLPPTVKTVGVWVERYNFLRQQTVVGVWVGRHHNFLRQQTAVGVWVGRYFTTSFDSEQWSAFGLDVILRHYNFLRQQTEVGVWVGR